MKFYPTIIKVNFIFLASLLYAPTYVAQETETITIEWLEASPDQYNGVKFSMPQIKNQNFDLFKPNFHYSKEVKKGFTASLELYDFKSEMASTTDIDYIAKFNIEIPKTINPIMHVTNGAGKRWLVVNFNPFFNDNGQIKRITELTIKKDKKTNNVLSVQKDFASESVLRPGSGDWYKISVNADGIYKIDKSMLSVLGIDVQNLNPQHINIYGNGDGKLPELNSIPRTDDLALNAIFVSGELDGAFDDEDYILFYGWGPDRWYGNTTTDRFEQDKNIYSNFSYYFININPTNTPERIQTAAVPAGSVTHNLSSYSFRDVYEKDLTNMVAAGQRWYGELFDIQLSRVFSFNVPNIDPTFNSTFKTTVATNYVLGGTGTQSFSLNGTQLLSTALPNIQDWGRSTQLIPFTSSNSSLNLSIDITRNTPALLTYLDRIELNTRRALIFFGSQFNFYDLPSVGASNIGEFTISNLPPENGFVWNVGDRQTPTLIAGSFIGLNYVFKANLDTFTEFVASNGVDFFAPTAIGPVENQDLHSLDFADNLIVAPKELLNQANRLADLHRNTGMTVHVVTTEEVYNEFSSGSLDPVAIRMFAKMFYDRAAGDLTKQPKFLTLFGDGTYDPKNRIGGVNWIPTYQFLGSNSSENKIGNLVSDDFYGMLDDTESITSADKVDIGIGRILAFDNQTAKELVDKIEHYLKNGSTLFAQGNVNCVDGNSTSTYGDWRTKVVNVADDENYFFYDQEGVYNTINTLHKEMNVDKLYMDAFPRVVTAGGYRFPQVFDAIVDRFEQGSLVINFVGHGGTAGLAVERVVSIAQIQALNNIDRLPMFVSATCEFTKYDDPSGLSAGEYMALNPRGGAIALMTTTRSVYYGVNSNTLTSFFNNAFVRNTDFSPRTFGQIVMEAKVGINDGDNKMAFTLIGDPALTLAMPRYKMVLDSVNGISPNIESDTVRALTKVKVKAHLEDFNGNVLTNFNGIATPSLYDKPKQQFTFGYNPPETTVLPFENQQNIIYRGKSTVQNGYFTFEFITPKDIDYAYGEGKFSFYANNETTDAIGEDTRVIIGGLNPNGLNDNEGPQIEMFLNNENFVNNGITNQTPFLIAKIFDENGINTVGNGIGHDITAILDGNTADPIVLNSYYTANLDTYQSGELRFQFNELSPGQHSLTLKVWDVNNNSSEQRIEFVVQENGELELEHVLNYPNPFTTNTEFYFEHNQCCLDLETQIQIYTISGKLVKTLNQNVYTTGYRSEGIAWDGRDDFGDQLAKGVYVYRLKVKTPDGLTSEKLEKLVLLR